VSRTIESAQTKVEGLNFDFRKHLVDYDNVLAKQRSIVYEDRNRILRGEDVRDILLRLIEEEVAEQVDTFCPGPHSEEWDTTGLYNAIGTIMPMPPNLTPDEMSDFSQDELADALIQAAETAYEEREKALGTEVVRAWERRLLLVSLSGLWITHVDAMDELRDAAMLQAFAQQDPLVAYRRQGYEMFQEFQVIFRKNVAHQIYHILFQPTASLILQETTVEEERAGSNGHAQENETIARRAASHSKRAKVAANRGKTGGKIGRNEQCYCGSGKKYKHCHGRI
jgi:preprotein translocase subunit SecA